MIVTITGGREHYPDPRELSELMKLLCERGATTVRTGGATGVDSVVFDHLVNTSVTIGTTIERVEKWMPDWKRYKGRAGTMRNSAMLTGFAGYGSGIDLARSFIFTVGQPSQLCISFSGGVGTMRCCERARDLGIPIEYIYRQVRRGPPS